MTFSPNLESIGHMGDNPDHKLHDPRVARLYDLKYQADLWCERNTRCSKPRGYFGIPYAKTVKDPRNMTSTDCGCVWVQTSLPSEQDTNTPIATANSVAPRNVSNYGVGDAYANLNDAQTSNMKRYAVWGGLLAVGGFIVYRAVKN